MEAARILREVRPAASGIGLGLLVSAGIWVVYLAGANAALERCA